MQQKSNAFYPARDPEIGLREDQQEFLETAAASLALPGLFYGSLRDPGVFETVVGRPMRVCGWEQVTIRGFRLGIATAGTGFPGLFAVNESPDTELECILVHDLNRFEQTMVAWYEWDEYLLQRIPLVDGRTAQTFVPNVESIRKEYGRFEIAPWSFATWQADQAGLAVESAREWMAQRPGDEALVRAGCFTPEDTPPSGPASSL